MLYFYLILVAIVSFLAGIFVAKRNFKKKLFCIYDNLKPSANVRSIIQKKQDAVMQLQNEIVRTGALKITDMEDGAQIIALTVYIE